MYRLSDKHRIPIISTAIFLFSIPACVLSQRPSCARGSCYPATGDLLIGREPQLSASSTCGLSKPQPYCILAHLTESSKSSKSAELRKLQTCLVCESTRPYFPTFSPNSHRIENVVYKIPRDRNRWWQSENGVNNVSITLNLEAEFHFTHLIMTFKTFRPAAMYIERSFNFGKSWKPYRYYSANCDADFPGVSKGPMRKIGDVICTNEYTDMSPSTGGEVIFRAVPSNLQKIKDPYSEAVQELVKLTNLRIVFTRLHTLGDLVFDSRPEVVSNYYYALYELNVRGSCSCYGHAERCVPDQSTNPVELMVYGKCECTHNTDGMNCHKCKPFYNDYPWRPATGLATNECKKCECNNHATRCHFDAAVFKASNHVSGGVCDNCMHNTQGKNCQECRPFYYQNDTLPISSPHICQPCNCDPFGSENRGECEQRTDKAAKTVAGRCICKKFAGGTRCDECKPGYWNFTKDNPDACQKCKCYLPGTFENRGCNQKTGFCTCKRFVTGDKCDSCMAGFYGLAVSIPEGCKPCDCDPGGSASSICEPRSGTCRCKTGMEGRRCDKVKPGYFVPRIDVNVFEVEDKKGRAGGGGIFLPANVTSPGHTGSGFIQLKPGDSIQVAIKAPRSGLWDVGIRLQPKEFGSQGWPRIRITITRSRTPDPNSFCGKQGAKQIETYYVNVNASSGAVFLPKSICFSPNESVKLEIFATPDTAPSEGAKINVDSVVLLPGPIDKLLKPLTGGGTDHREDWLYCRDLILSLLPTELPERCKKLKVSISVLISGKAGECKCSATGAISTICDPVGGQCHCKPGVTGNRCDSCKVYHYGFGATGCKPCDCDPRGSTNAQCHPITGQCPCINLVNKRKCEECKAGFWDFPNCRQCSCNLHSDTCDSITGKCFNCSDFTTGDNCERCRLGYYGDPRIGKDIKCKPCFCPGGLGSGYDRSHGCLLDLTTNRAKCLCKKGYAGTNCEKCATNYYGNPLNPKSKCRKCDCNDNIDRSVPNSCDSMTGTCLKCLHNTMGSNCQECMDGYYGNATERQCLKCLCYKLGTRKDKMHCNKKTGECHCLPNVKDRRCISCESGHWNITSGDGCSKCNCDPSGSLDSSCNLLSGQCKCKKDRGGLRCNECSDTYWGDPLSKEGCKKCECNPNGSKSFQCGRRDGKCRCNPGVTGDKCDRCDRGTRGKFPKCEPCGECWIRWYRIIDELFNKTKEFSKNAGKLTGSVSLPKGYANKLDQIEKKLKNIENLLKDNNITSTDVQMLQNQLNTIKKFLKAKGFEEGGFEETRKLLEQHKKDESGIIAVRKTLEKALKDLKNKVDELKKEAIDIKDSNIAGAYATIQDNKKKSGEAQKKLDDIGSDVEKLKERLDKTNADLKKEKSSLAPKLSEMENRAKQLDDQMKKMRQETLPTLNKKVCGWPLPIPTLDGRLCHSACGGGGCNKCGGAAVCKGSIDNMRKTEGYLKTTRETLEQNSKNVTDLEKKVKSLTNLAKETEEKAKAARDEAKKVASLSQTQDSAVRSLLDKMQKFLDSNRTRQQDLEKLLKEIKDTEPNMSDDDIKKLKEDIERRVEKLRNVDKILKETEKDRKLAEELKKDADLARKAAEELQKKADEISKDLEKAKKAQNDTNKEVDALEKAVDQMTTLLHMIRTLNKQTTAKNTATDAALKDAQNRVNTLDNALMETQETVNKIDGENAENSKKIEDLEKKIKDELKPKVKKVQENLEEKERLDKVLSERGKKLRDRIKKVNDTLTNQLKRLKDAEEKKRGAEVLLNSTEDKVNTLIKEIKEIFIKTREMVNLHQLC